MRVVSFQSSQGGQFSIVIDRFNGGVAETKVVSDCHCLYSITRYRNGTEDKVPIGAAYRVNDALAIDYWNGRQAAGDKTEKVAIYGQERTRFLTGYTFKPTSKTTLLVTKRGWVYRLYPTKTCYLWGERRMLARVYPASHTALYNTLTNAVASLEKKAVA